MIQSIQYIMIIKDFYSLNDAEKEIFFRYLKELPDPHLPAVKNVWDDSWQSKTNTLPYLLHNTTRFQINGQFNIVYINQQIAAFGGVYISDFCSQIGIAGARTYVDSNFRHKSLLRESLLPYHKKWCIDRELKIIALTFNSYNKNLMQVFKRRRLGEKLERITTKQPYHLFYNNFNEVPFPVKIQNTNQFVLYENLDKNFNYEWSKIKVDA